MSTEAFSALLKNAAQYPPPGSPNVPHGSAVMIDDGRIFGRWIWGETINPFERITVGGDSVYSGLLNRCVSCRVPL